MSGPKKIPAAFNDYILSGCPPPAPEKQLKGVTIPSTVRQQEVSSVGLVHVGHKRQGSEKANRRAQKRQNAVGYSLAVREAPQLYRPGEVRTVLQPFLMAMDDESNMMAHMLGGGNGFRLAPLHNMVATLSPDLKDAIVETMSTMKLVMMDREFFEQMHQPKGKMLRHLVSRLPARKANRLVMPDEVRNPSVANALSVSKTMMMPFYVRLVDDDYTDHPYMCEVRDLRTFRRVGLCFNRKICEIFGISSEEMFARVANSEFEMTDLSSELEVINCAVENYIAMLDKNSPDHKTAVLSKKPMWRTHLDKDGMLLKQYGHVEIDGHFVYKHIWHCIMPSGDYDKEVETEPEGCRPLLRAAGDTRSGPELEQQHKYDRLMSLEAMSASQTGSAFLSKFANAIRAKVAPIQRAASLGLYRNGSVAVSEGASFDSSAQPLSPPSFASTPEDDSSVSSPALQELEPGEDFLPPPALGSSSGQESGYENQLQHSGALDPTDGIVDSIQQDFRPEEQEWTEVFSFVDVPSARAEAEPVEQWHREGSNVFDWSAADSDAFNPLSEVANDSGNVDWGVTPASHPSTQDGFWHFQELHAH